MQEHLFHLFQQHPGIAIGISLLVSTIVAVLGLVPSVFVTAANLAFFGFWPGLTISFLGETLGAFVSFLIYRKGFKKRSAVAIEHFPKLQRLLEAEAGAAFMLVLSLRLLPFVPSGLVTFAAAIGRISTMNFLVASTLGKAPALLLEAWSVYEVTRFSTTGKIILAMFALGILGWLLLKPRKP